MIDIHCHILPGVDDGPADINTSIDMLKIAADDGISHIIATPHYMHNENPTVGDIEDRLQLLKEKSDQENTGITLLQGADIRLTYELTDAIEEQSIPTLNRTRYFLLELSDLIPPNIEDFLFSAELKGYVPIITHPERNYSFLSSPEKIETFRNSGALFQLTAISLTGGFGNRLKKFSEGLIKKGLIDFIASDAHSTGRRRPVLSKAYREASNLLNQKEVDRIFHENPRAVIENKELT